MNGIDLAAIDLNLLVVFEAVFDERNVGQAATRLHVSSSAVSHGLGRLRRLFDDPLFLRTPKGVVPTARAVELSPSIADALTRVRQLLGSVEPFDPATTRRRFGIGLPDALAAVVLPPLLDILQREAPGLDLGVRHRFPQTSLDELEAREIDVVLAPVEDVPARFFAKVVLEEQFVIAAREGHPFLRSPSLRRYCEARHVLASLTGDPHGYVDELLAKKGLSRRVALTVPHFMLALAALSETDLLAALPRSLVAAHAARFGLSSVKSPLPMPRFRLRAVTPRVALADAGVAWLFAALERAAQTAARARR